MLTAAVVERARTPGRPHTRARRSPARADRTFAARRWMRLHRVRWERWPVWRLAGETRSRIGTELELFASDLECPERPPRDRRPLYQGLLQLVTLVCGQVDLPARLTIEIQPYYGSLVVTPGAGLVFEVPLRLEVLDDHDAPPTARRRTVKALLERLAALKRTR